MKTAILIFGTFNPVTKAHIHIGEISKALVDADDVLYIPAKKTFMTGWKNLNEGVILEAKVRVKLLEDALKPYGFKVMSEEIDGIVDGKTYNTVHYIKEHYHYDKLYICFGTDKINELDRWYNAEQLVAENNFIIIDRDHKSLDDVKNTSNLTMKYIQNFISLEDDKYPNLSSSEIREAQINNSLETVKDFVPRNVYNYLLNNKTAFSNSEQGDNNNE